MKSIPNQNKDQIRKKLLHPCSFRFASIPYSFHFHSFAYKFFYGSRKLVNSKYVLLRRCNCPMCVPSCDAKLPNLCDRIVIEPCGSMPSLPLFIKKIIMFYIFRSWNSICKHKSFGFLSQQRHLYSPLLLQVKYNDNV